MRAQQQSALVWLRQPFQIQPGKPAYAYGVRILLILIGPVVAGFLLHDPKVSVIPTLSALSVGLITVGGTYRQQAKIMGGAAITVTLALLLANLISHHFLLTIMVTFALTFLLSFASIWGSGIASISITTLLMFIISLAKFSTFSNASVLFEQCLFCLVGGLWAMAIASLLWVVYPYAPVAEAVAESYWALSAIADYTAQNLFNVPNADTASSQSKNLGQMQDAAIQKLSVARNIWTSAWATEKTDSFSSARGNRLLASIEAANQMNHALVALAKLIETTAQSSFFQHLQPEAKQATAQVAIALKNLSTALKQNHPDHKQAVPLEALKHSTQALENQWKSLVHHIRAQTIAIQASDYTEIAHIRKIVVSISDLSTQIQTSANRIASSTVSGAQPKQTAKQTTKQAPQQFLSTQPDTISWLDIAKNNLTFNAATFRHALRLAILITLSQLLSSLLPIPRGYWVTLTVLFALKPDFGGTARVIGQRVFGTIVGSAMGIGLVMVIHNPLALALLLLLAMFAAISLRPLSYSLFIMMLTLVIVLIFEATGIGSWEIGIQRIVDTTIGGAIALAGIYMLFPSWERQQLPAQLEKTLQANLAYFQITMSQYSPQPLTGAGEQSAQPTEDPILASSLYRLRHQAALQNANAEAIAQRLFSEPRHVRGEIEPVMTLVFYIRSLYSSTTALAEHFKEVSSTNNLSQMEQLSDAIDHALLNLATAIGHHQPPPPLPPLENSLEAVCDRIQQLHSDRFSEMTLHSAKTTPTLQAIKTQTPIATELSQIVRIVKGLYSSAARIKP